MYELGVGVGGDGWRRSGESEDGEFESDAEPRKDSFAYELGGEGNVV